MNKTELEKQIKELEEKQAELQKQINGLKQVKIEEPKRWKPEIEDLYYYVCDGGTIIQDVWEDCITDDWRYLTGNVFKTAQEAEEYQNKIEIQSKFKNFVEERNEKLDWNDSGKLKHYLLYVNREKRIDFFYDYCVKRQGIVYASSKQILQDAIKEIGEDNIKKYVLEVEE